MTAPDYERKIKICELTVYIIMPPLSEVIVKAKIDKEQSLIKLECHVKNETKEVEASKSLGFLNFTSTYPTVVNVSNSGGPPVDQMTYAIYIP